jgi:hypothetical protein
MKRFYQLTGIALLTVFLAIGANAATTGSQGGGDTTQGIKNLKKVMQYRIQRDKKMHALQAQGQQKMMQAQSGKNSQRPQQAPNK